MKCASKGLALGFFGGSLATALSSANKSAFEESLDADQRVTWERVRRERLTIYLVSLLVATVLVRSRASAVGVLRARWAQVASVFFLVSVFYMVAPKRTYMVQHLRTDEQRALYIENYRHQQIKYYGSLALALTGVFFLC